MKRNKNLQKSFADVRTPITGETKAKALEYNMSDFMSQCVERYCELAKFERSKLKKAETPFLDENKLTTEEIYSTDT